MQKKVKYSKARILPIASAWVGPRLSYIERLCIMSMLRVGHTVTLYCYREPQNVPEGVELRDASCVMAEEKFIAYRNGSYALGSNLFRYNLLSQHSCIWVDLDMFLLKPIHPICGYAFGWEDQNFINTAVLALPVQSEMLRGIQDLVSRKPFYAPWWTDEQRMLQDEAVRNGSPLRLPDLPWATIGPKIVTHLAEKNGVSRHARPPEAFYPVHWRDFSAPFYAGDQVDRALTEESIGVHFWNHMLGDIKASPQPGSFVWRSCKEFGIEI